MNFSRKIKNLEKKGIISRKPNPIFPFVLAFISLLLGIIVKNINMNKFFSYTFFYLAGFTFIFAIIHLIIVMILKNNKK